MALPAHLKPGLTTIEIVPFSVTASNGNVYQANKFEVRFVSYTAPTAVAECYLWADDGITRPIELKSITVEATAEQCGIWTDYTDVKFQSKRVCISQSYRFNSAGRALGFFSMLAANYSLVAV